MKPTKLDKLLTDDTVKIKLRTEILCIGKTYTEKKRKQS